MSSCWCQLPAPPGLSRTPCMLHWARVQPCVTPGVCCLTPVGCHKACQPNKQNRLSQPANQMPLVAYGGGMLASHMLWQACQQRSAAIGTVPTNLLVQEAGLAGTSSACQQLLRLHHNQPRHDSISGGNGMNDVACHALRSNQALRCALQQEQTRPARLMPAAQHKT